MRVLSPASKSPTCRCRAATSAPSTIVPGPSSPPMASMAIRRLGLFDGLDLAALVVAAVGADVVRRLRLLALRTGANRHGVQGVVRAALGGPGLRMPPFRIRQLSSPCRSLVKPSAAPDADLPTPACVRTRSD